MSERIDRITGNICGHPCDTPRITGELRRFADSTLGWKIAEAVKRVTNADNKFWFTAWDAGATNSMTEAIHIGQELGLWAKANGRSYWQHNHYTWPFIMTALALRDEWMKRDDKELTQHDYDQHNWHRSKPAAERGEHEPPRAGGSTGE